jgi:hypothetical protein
MAAQGQVDAAGLIGVDKCCFRFEMTQTPGAGWKLGPPMDGSLGDDIVAGHGTVAPEAKNRPFNAHGDGWARNHV